jgi:hypothetical protein
VRGVPAVAYASRMTRTRNPRPVETDPGAALAGWSRALAAAALVAVAALAGASAAAAAADGIRGTYRVRGTARVDAGPVLSREVEVRADAVLRRGDRPRKLRVRLAAEGHACELDATLEERGTLAFAAGQRCTFDVRDPTARGRVDATLREGRGHVRERALALDLVWELSGGLSLRTRERLEVLGREVELPAAWTPELPVRGEARARAEGERDDSRSAER